jgi:alternate signal-mediated exported protein
MRKTAKGAVAAAAGVVLLLGGAGSLAYWTDSATVDGGAINSGHLQLLTDDTNPGCSAWTLDGGDPYDPDTSLVVPGDTLTESCTFTLSATGDHMQGTVEASAADITGDNALADDLEVSVSGITLNGTEATTFTEANDGQTLGVDVTVTLPGSSGNNTMDLSAALDDITVTATQAHP